MSHSFKKLSVYFPVVIALTVSISAFAQVKPMKSTPELLAKGKSSLRRIVQYAMAKKEMVMALLGLQ